MRPRTAPFLVNQSWVAQRVTGQQRYATEISERLLDGPGARSARPGEAWAGRGALVWLWALLVLPVVARTRVLVSLTSRAPLWARRHVVVVHDLFVLTNPEWFSRLYVWTHAPALRAQLRTAAALVAVSEPVADQLSGYGVPVRVAPNAPSEIFFAAPGPDDDAVLAEQGVERGTYLLAVGSLEPRKNLAGLVAAYRSLTPAEQSAHPLVLVGGSSSIYRDEALDGAAGVRRAGYVSDEELRALYAGAAAVVFVSFAEGFGLPLVEAAAAGAGALVISDIPVFRWVCGSGAHYVDPRSTAGIAAGLREALETPRRPEIDLRRFRWDTSAEAVREVCAEALRTGGSWRPGRRLAAPSDPARPHQDDLTTMTTGTSRRSGRGTGPDGDS